MLVTIGCVEPAAEIRDTGQVPRQMPRPYGPDDWIAERIRYERTRRGWSTAELARRLGMAGVPIRQQSVWQVESGAPRRKVSIGEAMALATVFEIPLEELTQPPTEVIDRDLVSLGRELAQWQRDAAVLFNRLHEIQVRAEHFERLAETPGDAEAILGNDAREPETLPETGGGGLLGQVRRFEIALSVLREVIEDPRGPWPVILSLRNTSGDGGGDGSR